MYLWAGCSSRDSCPSPNCQRVSAKEPFERLMNCTQLPAGTSLVGVFLKRASKEIRAEITIVLVTLFARPLRSVTVSCTGFSPGVENMCLGDFLLLVAPSPKAQKRSEEHTSELQSQSNLVCR